MSEVATGGEYGAPMAAEFMHEVNTLRILKFARRCSVNAMRCKCGMGQPAQSVEEMAEIAAETCRLREEAGLLARSIFACGTKSALAPRRQ